MAAGRGIEGYLSFHEDHPRAAEMFRAHQNAREEAGGVVGAACAKCAADAVVIVDHDHPELGATSPLEPRADPARSLLRDGLRRGLRRDSGGFLPGHTPCAAP